MKKGFTLIEILAVIVVLSVTMLIVIPNLTNLFSTSKESLNKKSVSNIARAGNQYYAMNVLDSDISRNIYYDLDFLGKKPENASVYINRNGDVTVGAIFDNKCYFKDYYDSEIVVTDQLDTCDIVPEYI